MSLIPEAQHPATAGSVRTCESDDSTCLYGIRVRCAWRCCCSRLHVIVRALLRHKSHTCDQKRHASSVQHHTLCAALHTLCAASYTLCSTRRCVLYCTLCAALYTLCSLISSVQEQIRGFLGSLQVMGSFPKTRTWAQK